jgi:hypothetical protein
MKALMIVNAKIVKKKGIKNTAMKKIGIKIVPERINMGVINMSTDVINMSIVLINMSIVAINTNTVAKKIAAQNHIARETQ